MINQPLPFYLNQEELTWKQDCCKGECIYELNAPKNSLIPFIIKRVSSPKQITGFRVSCFDGSNASILPVNLVTIACTVIEDGVKYDYIIYDGSEIGFDLPCGHHQATVITEDVTYYSELFYVGDFTAENSPFIRVDYNSDCSENGIPYSDLGEFAFYFFLSKGDKWGLPQITQDIIAEEDNFGREVRTGLRFDTRYLFQSGEVPFFIAQTWVSAIMHDELFITEENNGKKYEMKDVELTHIPDDNGCTHEVDMTFKLQEDAVSGSCCDELEKVECLSQSTVPNVISEVFWFQQGIIEALPPSVGDTYYIDTFIIGCPGIPPVEWCSVTGALATWNGSGWDYTQLNENDVIWNLALSALFMVKNGVLVEIPLITFTSLPGIPITTLDVEADIHPCYFGRLEWSYDGGSTYTEVAGNFSSDDLNDGVTVAPKGANPTHIRIVMFNYNCPEIIGNSIAI